MLKAAAIGAVATYAYAMINKSLQIETKLPASIANFAWVIPGAVAGIAAKKWG